ncbi:MAG TPA: hypothetical protein VKL99_08520 [Candidatus Angelobacter sp.]|nr:hypothetical protein [Candidatus Angelobacter sp.]
MWLQIAPVFLFGMLTGYIDIDSFFREKRISYTAADNLRFWFFLLLNGVLSAAFLFWALSSAPDSPINKSIQVQNPWAKMFIIGFAVPLLVRSKLFSFGENQTAAGPALAYDWLRLKTFISIHVKSGDKKDRITDKYSARLAGRAGIDTQIKDWVDTYVKPFATSAQQAELDAEFARIQARYAGAAALSQDHISKLIRWAIDNAAINYVESKLKKF